MSGNDTGIPLIWLLTGCRSLAGLTILVKVVLQRDKEMTSELLLKSEYSDSNNKVTVVVGWLWLFHCTSKCKYVVHVTTCTPVY